MNDVSKMYNIVHQQSLEKQVKKTYKSYNKIIRYIKWNAKHNNSIIEIDGSEMNIFLLCDMLKRDGFSATTNSINKVLVIL